ncbi:MAG: hypothetical protein NTW21_12555 [Verrucomicrobia bacterium]|nr:hypothetical protein [Verrucomicrobiota bacterium]
MHLRSPLIRHLILAWWVGLAASVCGKNILTHTDPMGEKLAITCPFDEAPNWCFLPMELQAENPGKNPADWQVSVSSADYFSGLNLHSSVGFRARPLDASRGSALVPMGSVTLAGNSFNSYNNFVRVEATRSGGGTGTSSINTNTRGSSQSYGSRTALLTAGVGGRLGPSSGTLFNHSQAPGDWRAYCGFHSLYISDTEWGELMPAARTAIKHWIRLGGRLLVMRTAAGKSLAEMGLPKSDSGQDTGGVSLGIVEETTNGDRSGLQGDNEKAMANDWVVRATSGLAVREWQGRDRSAFATPSAKVAAGFMLVVVLVFAILVGPLNVFVFAAARRRHRLFVTTPLISLAAGGLLVVSVILSDGIGGQGMRYVWLESGPGNDNTNYLVQHQHSRCGAMFATGFEIPEDAFFAPMMLDSGELSGSLTINLEPGKVKAGGPWFSSRRSQSFFLAAARPGRGRIEKSGPDERPVLTSAFDFPIDRIFWLAADGQTWWQAGAMAQGTATALQPCTAEEVQRALAAAAAHAPPEYGRDLTSAIRRPGYFLALANAITAIETHQSIRWQTHGFVTGPVVTP